MARNTDRGNLRYVEGGGTQAPGMDMSGVAMLGSLGERLGRFQHTMKRQAIVQADRATQLYLGEQSLAIDKKLGELETQYESDPAGWETASKAYLEGVFAEMPQQVRPLVELEAQHKTRVIGKGIKNRFEQNLDSEVESRIRGELERTQGHLERAVRDGDDEAAAFHGGKLDLLVRLGAGEQADSTLGAAQAFSTGRRLFTPAQETAYRERAASAVRVQSVLGGFERTKNKRAFVKSVEAGEGLAQDLLPDERDQLVNRFQREIEHEDALFREAQREREKVVADEVGDIVARLHEGFPVGEDEIRRARGAASGFGRLATKLASAERNAGVMLHVRRLPTDEAKDALDAMKRRPGLTEEDVAFIKRAEVKVEQEAAAREDDKLSAAEKVGIVELEELDLDNPDTMTRRREAKRKVEAVWDGPAPLLTKGETAKLAMQYREQKDPGPRAEFLAKVYRLVGPEDMRAVSESLMKEGSRAAAVAGSLMAEGAQDVAQRVIDGETWIREGQVGKVAAERWRPVFEKKLQKAFGHDPEMQGIVIESALSYLASVKGESGRLSDDEVADDELEAAVDAVTGGVHEVGRGWFGGRGDSGFDIVAPVRGMTTQDVTDWVEGLQPEDFAGVDKADRVAEAVRSRGRLETTFVDGSVGYLVYVDEMQVQNADGTPFVLRYSEAR